MKFVSGGLGGIVLAWDTDGVIPDEVALIADGTAVGFRRLTRLSSATMPVANLADPAGFLQRARRVRLLGEPLAGAEGGAGLSSDWSVAGEDTPFVQRKLGDDPRTAAWDLSDMLALPAPAPATDHVLRLDLAQHRCGLGLAIEWLDGEGAVIRREQCWRDEGPVGGREPSGYRPLSLASRSPDVVASVRVLLLQSPAADGGDAYAFFRRPLFAAGDPEGRTVLPLPAGIDPDRLRVVPVGDALALFPRPLVLDDGAARLVVPDTVEPAPPYPATLTLDLNGAELAVSGSGDVPAERTACVVVDGTMVATTTLRRTGGHVGGTARLDPALFDGGEHWMELLGAGVGETLAAGALHFPFHQTAPAALATLTSHQDRPGALPFADERYRALVATLDRLAEQEAEPWLLREVAAAHTIVARGPDPDLGPVAPRRWPEVAEPRFSVVIPCHDQFHHTHACLAALLLTCAGLPVEVIVVDDGSTDRTAELERHWSGVRVVRHDVTQGVAQGVAQGFVRACNAGAAAARGAFIVFLNNDTEPAGRWLDELYLPFRAFADVGMTGARLVWPDGRLQDAGNIVWNNGRPWNLGRGGNRADPAFNYTRSADYLSGAAFMIARAAWKAAGGFSAEFAPAYYEDTDLAFQVRARGFRTLYAPKAMVIHHEGASNGTDLTGGLKRFQRINRPRFEAKWRAAFRGHATEGTRPEREKDRGAIGRALVLDYQVPRFDRDAGSVAIAQEIWMLQLSGYKVTVAPLNLAWIGMYSETLERGGVECLHAPFHASVADVLARRGAEFDLVYVHRWTTAAGLLPLIRRDAPQARLLVNCADLHFLREMRAARAAADEGALAAARTTRLDELAVLEEADAVLTYSEVERGVLEAMMGMDAAVHLLPFVAPDPPASAPRHGIGFLGSWDHPPNRDAVRFFLAEVWPRVRDAYPDLRFRIAGSGFEKLRLDRPDDRVDLIGWVPDAAGFLASCRVAVAPLLAGAGIKGKVVDALAAGTPSVLSPVAAEGLALDEAGAALVATTPDEWVAALATLLGSATRWEEAAAACRTRAARFAIEAALPRFQRILAAVDLPFDPAPAGPVRVPAPLVSYDRLYAMAREGAREGASA